MTVAQLYVSPNGDGQQWVPWDGKAPALAFDEIAFDAPDVGQPASVTLPSVEGKSYLITGLYGHAIADGSDQRLMLRLWVDGVIRWATHFMPAAPASDFSMSSLSLKFEPGAEIMLEWFGPGQIMHTCSCAITYRLI